MEHSYIKAVIDCDTNKVTHVPMTADEIVEFERMNAESEARRAQEAETIAATTE
jgi:hypothetical protein